MSIILFLYFSLNECESMSNNKVDCYVNGYMTVKGKKITICKCVKKTDPPPSTQA